MLNYFTKFIKAFKKDAKHISSQVSINTNRDEKNNSPHRVGGDFNVTQRTNKGFKTTYNEDNSITINNNNITNNIRHLPLNEKESFEEKYQRSINNGFKKTRDLISISFILITACSLFFVPFQFPSIFIIIFSLFYLLRVICFIKKYKIQKSISIPILVIAILIFSTSLTTLFFYPIINEPIFPTIYSNAKEAGVPLLFIGEIVEQFFQSLSPLDSYLIILFLLSRFFTFAIFMLYLFPNFKDTNLKILVKKYEINLVVTLLLDFSVVVLFAFFSHPYLIYILISTI